MTIFLSTEIGVNILYLILHLLAMQMWINNQVNMDMFNILDMVKIM